MEGIRGLVDFFDENSAARALQSAANNSPEQEAELAVLVAHYLVVEGTQTIESATLQLVTYKTSQTIERIGVKPVAGSPSPLRSKESTCLFYLMKTHKWQPYAPL